MRHTRTFATLTLAAILAAVSLASATSAHALPISAEIAPIAVSSSQTVNPVLAAMADESMDGVKDSVYKGKYYLGGKNEAYRRCVLARESNGHYYSTNRSGGYFGGYQFSQALATGASWMLVEEHKDILGAEQAKAVLAQLRDTEMHKWPRYWQDAAFFTVLNWDGAGSGVKHWAGGRYSCSL